MIRSRVGPGAPVRRFGQWRSFPRQGLAGPSEGGAVPLLRATAALPSRVFSACVTRFTLRAGRPCYLWLRFHVPERERLIMSAGSDIEHGAIGNGQFNQFFVPEAMLTPGVAGGTTMVIANALAFNLGVPTYASILGLILSFMFGALIITSHRQWWTRIIYYVLNSLIIFCVAFGAGNLAATARPPSVQSFNILFPSAYADSATRNSQDAGRNSDDTARESDHNRRRGNSSDTSGNAGQRPNQRPNVFFQPWSNPFAR
jgi:hypothetical protein